MIKTLVFAVDSENHVKEVFHFTYSHCSVAPHSKVVQQSHYKAAQHSPSQVCSSEKK